MVLFWTATACGAGLVAGYSLWAMVTRRSPFRSRAGLALVMYAWLGLALLNLSIGGLVYWHLHRGATALAGKVEDGQYFLGSHGIYTEVSRAVWWTSYWYWLLSGIAFLVPFAGCFALQFSQSRSRRRSWLARVRELAKRDDLESLYELIDLLDDRTPYEFGRGRVDRRELLEAIRDKAGSVDEAVQPPLTPDRVPEVAQEHRQMWRQWVKLHEAELTDHFSKSRPVQPS